MPNNVFPYPGNKARHADWILDHIPEHECYVELFGGAAGVLFNKPRSKIEVYNDLNGDIPHFFRVLRDDCEKLQEWLRNVPYSREVYTEWADEYYAGERQNDDIARAGRFFALRYMQFGGKVEDKAGFANKSPHRSAGGQFVKGVECLNEFRNRLRRVEIESKKATSIISQRDSKHTLFYADPPYEGSESQYNSKGFNHKELYQRAKDIQGKILISYDSIPCFYDECFNVVSKSGTHKMESLNGGKDITEYLIMNYDIDGEQIMSGVGQQTLV